jgi:hypothetical protein
MLDFAFVSVQIRKLPDGEKPLQLWLKWEEEDSVNQWKLVLQENETGEIMVRETLGYYGNGIFVSLVTAYTMFISPKVASSMSCIFI